MTEQPSHTSQTSNHSTSASQLSVNSTCLQCASSPKMTPCAPGPKMTPCAPSPKTMPCALSPKMTPCAPKVMLSALSADGKLSPTEKLLSDATPFKHSYPRLEPRMNPPPPPPAHANRSKGIKSECCRLETRKTVQESNPKDSILKKTASRNKKCGVSRHSNMVNVARVKLYGKPPFLTPRAFPPPPPPSPLPPPPPPHSRPPGQHLAKAETVSDHSIDQNKPTHNGIGERESSTLQQKGSCQSTTADLPVQSSSCINRSGTERSGDKRVYHCLLDFIQANLSCWPVKDLPLFRFITLLFLAALHE